jgi:hypothetical protein
MRVRPLGRTIAPARRKSMRSVFAVVAAAIGIACASPGKAKVNQASVVQATDSKPLNGSVASNDQTKGKKHIVCDYEIRVGTHLREEVCRYQEDIDEERVETQHVLERQNKQNAKGN